METAAMETDTLSMHSCNKTLSRSPLLQAGLAHLALEAAAAGSSNSIRNINTLAA